MTDVNEILTSMNRPNEEPKTEIEILAAEVRRLKGRLMLQAKIISSVENQVIMMRGLVVEDVINRLGNR